MSEMRHTLFFDDVAGLIYDDTFLSRHIARMVEDGCPPTERDQFGRDLVARYNCHDELVAALQESQKVLAILTEPEAIRSTTVHNAWAQAVAAEQKARAALSKAQAVK